MAPKEPTAQAPVQENTARSPQHADSVHHGPQQPTPAAVPQATAQPAAPAAAAGSAELILPLKVTSRSDVSKSLRELELVEDYFHQAAIRGNEAQTVPVLSSSLEALAAENSLNLIHAEDRSRLRDFLTRLKAKAPVVHMSFPSEASGEFIMKLLGWFRSEVHPHVVLHIGLQPELAAGCTLRTPNKAFDFSFRNRFEQSKQKLIAALEATGKVDAEKVSAVGTGAQV